MSKNNFIFKDKQVLKCTCGAKESAPNKIERFKKRHPAICNQKAKDKEFSRKLAVGTKSVEDSDE